MSEIYIAKDDTVSEVFIATEVDAGTIVHKQVAITGSGVDDICVFPTKLPNIGNTVIFITAVDDYFDIDASSTLESITPAMTTALVQAGQRISFDVSYKVVQAGDNFNRVFSKWVTDDRAIGIYLELSGSFTLDQSALTNSSALGSTVTTLSTGTTGTLAEVGELAFAMFFNDSQVNIAGTRTWTNNYVEFLSYKYEDAMGVGDDFEATPGFSLASKIVQDTSAQESTFSYTGGSADEAQACMLVFRGI